ncbi:MAG: hypothetical protein OXB88_00065 [Bacteriovoracales bacterium]|nr:hypothetical protein [Bacteriovoracales bacterium]
MKKIHRHLLLLCFLAASCSGPGRDMVMAPSANRNLAQKTKAPTPKAPVVKKIRVREKKITKKTSPAKETGPTVKERADELYGRRGRDVQNARRAALLYGRLAETANDDRERAQMIGKRAQALWYVGVELEKEKEGLGKKSFEECYAAADTVVQLFDGPESMEEEEQKALGLFWYGACLGQAKKDLFGASKVKKAMNDIIDLGYEEIQHYGAHRALGRIEYFMPWYAGGDKTLSKEYHKKAFENTLVSDTIKVSVHGLNNLYYADILSHKDFKEIDLACHILQTFVEQDPKTLLKSRIPETIYEMEEARKKIKSLQCRALSRGGK